MTVCYTGAAGIIGAVVWGKMLAVGLGVMADYCYYYCSYNIFVYLETNCGYLVVEVASEESKDFGIDA